MPGPRQPKTQVDVFIVADKTLVEESDFRNRLPTIERRGPARRENPSPQVHGCITRLEMIPLHCPAGHRVDVARGIDQVRRIGQQHKRRHRPHPRLVERLERFGQPGFVHMCVIVQKRHERSRRQPHSGIAASGKPEVEFIAPDRYVRPRIAKIFDAFVGRSIVNDDHPKAIIQLGLERRHQSRQIPNAVVVRDNDGHERR